MLYLPTLISVIEVLLVTVPVLLTVAYVTVAERKTMASMQRRLGPNAVGQLNLNFTFNFIKNTRENNNYCVPLINNNFKRGENNNTQIL
jgi:NADH:ubiquinone oxidoreductase subunit H